MARPTIGITCSVGDIRSGEWDEHAAYSPIAYVRCASYVNGSTFLVEGGLSSAYTTPL
jgi:hypothetical protein